MLPGVVQELERLVCGNPQLDFDALQSNAKYDGGYNASTQVHASAGPQAASYVLLAAAHMLNM